MNYPFSNAEWFSQSLPHTSLFRGRKVGILTIGHLRTAEALGIGFLAGKETSAIDWGLFISIAQMDWRKSRSKASRSGLLWRWRRDKNTPRDYAELRKVIEWLNSQNYFPTRMFLDPKEKASLDEASQFAINRASSTIERLALQVASIPGWQSITNCKCVWDVPMISATHLLVAQGEMQGQYHVPYELIWRAKQHGKGTTRI